MASVCETRLGSLVGSRANAANSASRFLSPRSASSFTAMTGVTASGLYLCNEASGALAEVSGGTSLAASGSPTYGYQVGDRRGIAYPSGASHGADIYPLGTSSWWYVGVVTIAPSPGGNALLVGRVDPFSVKGAWLYSQGGGASGFTLQVKDNVVAAAVVSDTTPIDTGVWLAQLQIDRTATTARARLSRIGGGPAVQVSVSIAGFATLDGAIQQYGAGQLAGATYYGAAAGWLAAATGAQVEGANFLAAQARNLGAE